MTKREIIENVQKVIRQKGLKSVLTQTDISLCIDGYLEVLKNIIKNEGVLLIKDFGSFKVKKTAQRTCRNPQTGEKMIVPARNKLTFKVSRNMNKELNNK